ncbi:MAG: DeoR/GlpR family DNA-binding transcription regulator [Beutenbergiaceae bacterium]
MTIDERRSFIERRLHSAGKLSYDVLAEELGVSEMTIRRDVEVLEEQGKLRRVLGGVIPFVSKGEEPSFESRLIQGADEKRHIADAVVALLEPHETVILDGGSTVLAVARAISGKGLGLTVVTSSVLAALELADEPETSIFLTGGALRPGELSLIGTETQTALQQYNCDTYIAGVAGVHATRGFSDYNSEESSVKRAAIASADRVIVPVDSSKLGKTNLVSIAPLSAASIIVTDGPRDHALLAAARRIGVEVIHC